MSARDRQRWDTIYKECEGEPPPAPDPLMFQYTPPAKAGTSRALDLAGGFGQNGMWLSSQGYSVDVIDISRVALQRGQEESNARRLRHMNFYQADLDEITLQPDTFDLICVFRYLRRDLFPQIRAAVRPGGRVIYETFNIRHLSTMPDFNPEYLLRPGELAGYFADWKLLYKSDQSEVSQIVAVKPG
jgi:tellurite methyltransferase